MLEALLSALSAAAALALGVPLAMFFLQERLLFFPQPLAETRPSEVAAGFPQVREIVIATQDGAQLHAWHLPGPPGAPLAIYFGGNAEEVSWIIGDAAARTPGAGWLLTSYRGYGKSTGAPSEAALSADALAWYDHMVAQAGPSPVVAFGRSLGSGVAVYLAAHRKVDGVILVTPYDSLVEVAKHHYPWLPVGLLLRHRFDSAAWAPGIGAPLLCIAAARDEVIPVVRSKRLFDAWKGPKRWVELPGAAHNGTDADPRFWRAIRSFLEKKNEEPA